MNDDEILSIQASEQSYVDLGFGAQLGRTRYGDSGGNDGFLSQDDADVLFEGISSSKSNSGIQRSPSNALEIDWDKGLITINFPGGLGSLKFGNVGSDNNGNAMFGTILNDGITDRSFDGFQKGGF